MPYYSASCLGSSTHMTAKSSSGTTPGSRFLGPGKSFLVNLICYGIRRIHCCISYVCLAVVVTHNRNNWGSGRVGSQFQRVESSWQMNTSWKTQFTAVGPWVEGCSLTLTDQEPESEADTKSWRNLHSHPSACPHFLKVP